MCQLSLTFYVFLCPLLYREPSLNGRAQISWVRGEERNFIFLFPHLIFTGNPIKVEIKAVRTKDWIRLTVISMISVNKGTPRHIPTSNWQLFSHCLNTFIYCQPCRSPSRHLWHNKPRGRRKKRGEVLGCETRASRARLHLSRKRLGCVLENLWDFLWYLSVCLFLFVCFLSCGCYHWIRYLNVH